MERLKTLNQMLTDNPNLLVFANVPAAHATELDSTALKTAIIRRCGDVAPYYQTAGDFSLYGALWFETHKFLFDHAVNVWNATYNPIENYDRIEEETTSGTRETTGENTDTHSGTDSRTTSETHDTDETHSGTDTTTTSGTKSGSDTHSGTDTLTDNVTRENQIAGFNSSDYSDANEETETGTHSTQHGEVITKSETDNGSEAVLHGHTVSTEEETSGSDALSYGHTIASASESAEETETTRQSHIHGNIGVTTAQQMIEAELSLANKFWIYDYIASAFETDNFITVYNSYWEGEQWH